MSVYGDSIPLRCTLCFLGVKAELDQLKTGLSVLGVGEVLSSHSELLAPLFVFQPGLYHSQQVHYIPHIKTFVPFLLESIQKLFGKVYYSPSGSTEREKEESTYMLFLDLLYASEDLENRQGINIDLNTPLSGIIN